MENLYIKIEDGDPVNHPMLESNVLQVYPSIDLNNLPDYLAKFERVPAPTKGIYEILEGPAYHWVDGVVKDVWTVRLMTEQEKLDLQNSIKDSWTGPTSWQFNEELAAFLPPIPYPDDGKMYSWDEGTVSWVAVEQ